MSEEASSFLLRIPRPVKTYYSQTYPRIAPTHFDYHGKTILITGGATGIGFSIAKAFGEAGAERLVLISRSPGPQAVAKEELYRSFAQTTVEIILASITDSARMAAIFEQIGRIDVLVMSAASSHDFAPPDQITAAGLEETYATNVFAPFSLVQQYLRLPHPAGASRTIINISSASAHMRLPGQAGYSSSKAAFASALQHFAAGQKVAEGGVRMFSLHPGAFYTPLVRTQMAEDAFPWEDIRLPAHFALWLASGEADFLHGRFVWAHWDVEESSALREKLA